MKRIQLAGLVATLLAVGLLAGSMILGLVRDRRGAPAVVSDAGTATRVRVEVLNAAGVPGLARAATERLRDAGFDVVYFGNAGSSGGDTSMVLHRAGRPDDARRVAEALSIGRVRTRPDTTLYLEATVVLGRDWSGIERDPAPRPDSGGP